MLMSWESALCRGDKTSGVRRLTIHNSAHSQSSQLKRYLQNQAMSLNVYDALSRRCLDNISCPPLSPTERCPFDDCRFFHAPDKTALLGNSGRKHKLADARTHLYAWFKARNRKPGEISFPMIYRSLFCSYFRQTLAAEKPTRHAQESNGRNKADASARSLLRRLTAVPYPRQRFSSPAKNISETRRKAQNSSA